MPPDIPAAKLNALVAEFRNALRNPRIDPRPSGQKLYDILVKPLEGDLAGAGAKTLIPMHYGTFDLSDEPPGAPVEMLLKDAEAAGLSGRVKPLGIYGSIPLER